MPKGIEYHFNLDTWKQLCKLFAMGIDPLSEEQLVSSKNDEIKIYSFAEWQYFKTILWQTFYFKEIKALIVDFKTKFKRKIDVTFKFQQQVYEKIYTYDPNAENFYSEISIFKLNKTDNTVMYPKGKNFNFRLIAIVDGKEYEANLTPWKSFSNLKWAEDCYFLPIVLMWAVNNYFNTNTTVETQKEEK